MNSVFELLKNPLVKIIALFLILYLGLYKNKEDPESLGTRLSTENVEVGFQQAKDHAQFIISNVNQAQELQKNGAIKKRQEFSKEEIAAIEVLQNVVEKEGEGDVVSCGDEVVVNYGIYGALSKNKIEYFKNAVFEIGDKEDIFVDTKLRGMKKGEVLTFVVPKHFKTSFEKVKMLLRFNQVDLLYRIELLDFKSLKKENCN